MDLDREQYINSVNLNIDTDFPYLVLDVINDNSFPRNPGFHVMHWHEDLQFILVLDGTIEVQTLDTSVLIRTGEDCSSTKMWYMMYGGWKIVITTVSFSQLISSNFMPEVQQRIL